MDQATKNELFRLINSFDERLDTTAKSRSEVENLGIIKLIVGPLFSEEGYSIRRTNAHAEFGADLVAERKNDGRTYSVGVLHNRANKRRIDERVVEQALGGISTGGLDRNLIIVDGEFTEQAQNAARRAAPGTLELLDTNALRAWVGRIDVESNINKLEIEQILKVTSGRLAKRIAEEPDYVERLQWWEMEQLVADLFDGLGFEVTLTPSSKDGGKDVILECTVKGKQKSYVVEIKHWRSEQLVGKKAVSKFLNVLVREQRDGGLFLSTYGYANNAFESLTQVQRQTLRFGENEKIVGVCKQYLKMQSGIWSPPEDLSTLIFSETV